MSGAAVANGTIFENVKTKLQKKDIRGREIPVIIKNSEHIIKIDTVIIAFGFRPNPSPWFIENNIK